MLLLDQILEALAICNFLKNSAVNDEEWLVPISTSHKRYRMVLAVSYQYEQGFSVTDVILCGII